MMQLRLKSFAAAVLGLSGVVLTGCGGLNSTVPIAKQGPALHGNVHGGQQPIIGATIQLYAAGSSGYGSAYPSYPAGRTSLLTTTVLTDAGGSFDITGDYQCPSPTTGVYLVAYGGQPAGPASPANSSIALMAALGPCGLLSSSTYVVINEITTVASVWALSPFMAGVANIGTTSTNPQGLLDAFATVNKLTNTTFGGVSGPALPAGATIPVAKINTLADILAACVNSAGDTGVDSACDMLFTAATVNSVRPTDTITAAMNLAQHPNQGTSLYMIAVKDSPFQPTVQDEPTDFSLVITYSGGGLSTPSGIATDLSGNVWVANFGGNSLTKLDALGTTSTDPTGVLSGANGYKIGPLSAPTAVALDQSGNAWVTNGGNNTVAKVSSDGSGSSIFQGGGLSGPSSVSIDAGGNAWVANGKGASVTLINSSGTLSNFNGGGIASPSAIAIDPK